MLMKCKFKIRKCGNIDYISFETGAVDIPLFYHMNEKFHFVGNEGGCIFFQVNNKETHKLLRKTSKLHFIIENIYEM